MLASKIRYLHGLATDGVNVYWSDYADDTVKRVSVNGGQSATLAKCGGPVYIAVDAGGVYCAHGAEEEGEEILGFRKSDGAVISRAIIPDGLIFRFAPDETNLYVICSRCRNLGW